MTWALVILWHQRILKFQNITIWMCGSWNMKWIHVHLPLTWMHCAKCNEHHPICWGRVSGIVRRMWKWNQSSRMEHKVFSEKRKNPIFCSMKISWKKMKMKMKMFNSTREDWRRNMNNKNMQFEHVNGIRLIEINISYCLFDCFKFHFRSGSEIKIFRIYCALLTSAMALTNWS